VSAPKYIADAFKKGGQLEEVFGVESYEPRTGQVRMTLAVDNAILSRQPLMVEAPCGTGKSIAHLIPLAYHTTHNHTTAVVSTANIALQNQLMDKDLPTIQQLFPDLRYALIKGKNNYLCRYALQQSAQESLDYVLDEEGYHQATMIRVWSNETNTGDKSELDFLPRADVWRKFSSSHDDCLGKGCKYADECWSTVARRRAAGAHIIVTNHHLLISHVASDGKVLPNYDYLVCDEAHDLPHIARERLGWSMMRSTFTRVSDWAANVGKGKQAEALLKLSRAWLDKVEKHATSRAYDDVRLYGPLPFSCDKLLLALQVVENKALGMSMDGSLGVEEKAKAARAWNQAVVIQQRLKSLACAGDGEWVHWIQQNRGRDGRTWFTIEGRPLDVAKYIRRGIFEATPTTILTSATLASAGDFSFLAGEEKSDSERHSGQQFASSLRSISCCRRCVSYRKTFRFPLPPTSLIQYALPCALQSRRLEAVL